MTCLAGTPPVNKPMSFIYMYVCLLYKNHRLVGRYIHDFYIHYILSIRNNLYHTTYFSMMLIVK